MPAYLVVDVARIHDEQAYGRYRKQVSPNLLSAGGQYLARGGAIDVLEGDWRPSRIVLVQFESAASARAWWESDEYAALKRLRQESTRTNMILVEGSAAGGAP